MGVLQRGLVVVIPPGLEVEAAEAETMGVAMLKHRFESGDGALPVARELRSLGLQKRGHRLMRDVPARLGEVGVEEEAVDGPRAK